MPKIVKLLLLHFGEVANKLQAENNIHFFIKEYY